MSLRHIPRVAYEQMISSSPAPIVSKRNKTEMRRSVSNIGLNLAGGTRLNGKGRPPAASPVRQPRILPRTSHRRRMTHAAPADGTARTRSRAAAEPPATHGARPGQVRSLRAARPGRRAPAVGIGAAPITSAPLPVAAGQRSMNDVVRRAAAGPFSGPHGRRQRTGNGRAAAAGAPPAGRARRAAQSREAEEGARDAPAAEDGRRLRRFGRG